MPPFLLPTLGAFLLCLLLHLTAKKFFPRLKLLDTPQKYGLERGPLSLGAPLVSFCVPRAPPSARKWSEIRLGQGGGSKEEQAISGSTWGL